MRLTSCVVIMLALGPLASAQSLADLAKKEEARRATMAPAKSYSNRDLVFDPNSVSAKQLESAPPQDRPKIAAAQFLSYFLKHTRAYADYCRENWGVEIGDFVRAFSEAHQTEYPRAKKIVADAGASEEVIWSVNEKVLRQSVAQEMTSIPTVRGSLVGCNALNGAAATLAREFHFSKVFPDAHRILMAPPPPPAQ